MTIDVKNKCGAITSNRAVVDAGAKTATWEYQCKHATARVRWPCHARVVKHFVFRLRPSTRPSVYPVCSSSSSFCCMRADTRKISIPDNSSPFRSNTQCTFYVQSLNRKRILHTLQQLSVLHMHAPRNSQRTSLSRREQAPSISTRRSRCLPCSRAGKKRAENGTEAAG